MVNSVGEGGSDCATSVVLCIGFGGSGFDGYEGDGGEASMMLEMVNEGGGCSVGMVGLVILMLVIVAAVVLGLVVNGYGKLDRLKRV